MLTALYTPRQLLCIGCSRPSLNLRRIHPPQRCHSVAAARIHTTTNDTTGKIVTSTRCNEPLSSTTWNPLLHYIKICMCVLISSITPNEIYNFAHRLRIKQRQHKILHWNMYSYITGPQTRTSHTYKTLNFVNLMKMTNHKNRNKKKRRKFYLMNSIEVSW